MGGAFRAQMGHSHGCTASRKTHGGGIMALLAEDTLLPFMAYSYMTASNNKIVIGTAT